MFAGFRLISDSRGLLRNSRDSCYFNYHLFLFYFSFVVLTKILQILNYIIVTANEQHFFSKIYNFSLIIIFQKYQVSFISLCMWMLQMFNVYVLYSLAFICNISFAVRSTYIIRSLRITKIDNTQKTMSIVMCPEIIYRISRLTKGIRSKNIWYLK